MPGADDRAHRVRQDQADEARSSADRDEGSGQQRRAHEEQHPQASDRDAECLGGGVAQHEAVEWAGRGQQRHRAHDHGDPGQGGIRPIGAAERAEQPGEDLAGSCRSSHSRRSPDWSARRARPTRRAPRAPRRSPPRNRPHAPGRASAPGPAVHRRRRRTAAPPWPPGRSRSQRPSRPRTRARADTGRRADCGVSACITAPHRARPPPTAAAVRTRGTRPSQMIASRIGVEPARGSGQVRPDARHELGRGDVGGTDRDRRDHTSASASSSTAIAETVRRRGRGADAAARGIAARRGTVTLTALRAASRSTRRRRRCGCRLRSRGSRRSRTARSSQRRAGR